MKEETICQKRMHGYSFITPRSVLDSDVTYNHTWHCSFWRNLFIRIPRRNHASFQYCINLSRSKFKVYLFGGFTPTLCSSENPESINTIVLLKAHHDDVMESMDKSHRFKFQKVNAKIYPSQNPHELTAQVTHCCTFCFGSYVTEKDTDDAIRFNLIEIKPNAGQ